MLAAASFCILATSCFHTIRGSASHLARGQARVFLSAAAILSVPAAATAVLGTPDVRLAAVTTIVALLPFPVGYAISRYQVADLDESFRALLAHGLYLSLWSLSFFLLIFAVHDRLDVPPVLKHPTVTFACVYCVLAPLDYLRSRLKTGLQSLVVARRVDWDRLGRDFARRIAGERTPRGIARAICDAIRAGLSEPGVVVLVAEGTALQVAHAVGSRAFFDASLAAELAAWSEDSVIDLNRAAELSGPAKEAHDAGVGAFARIENSDGLLGCVIVFPERRPRLLAASERMWIATVCGHAASALASTKFEEELRAAERSAARGRLEAELAHEIGKPLGVLELTAERLIAAMSSDDPVVPQLGRIHRLATHVREMTRAILQAEKKSAQAKLEDIVEAACEEVRALHDDVRLVVSPLPTIGALPSGYERLVRVLVNLIDNAVHASGAAGVAELRARVRDGALELIVDDNGD
ncbi:MAG TPA: HAMP domain-containing sensor histidine kinase, partial [Myxococcota bacterium]|nr:HAMP domain-containing sensor histidine kinase [Myxococcota bacterium]